MKYSIRQSHMTKLHFNAIYNTIRSHCYIAMLMYQQLDGVRVDNICHFIALKHVFPALSLVKYCMQLSCMTELHLYAIYNTSRMK